MKETIVCPHCIQRQEVEFGSVDEPRYWSVICRVCKSPIYLRVSAKVEVSKEDFNKPKEPYPPLIVVKNETNFTVIDEEEKISIQVAYVEGCLHIERDWDNGTIQNLHVCELEPFIRMMERIRQEYGITELP